MAAEMYEVYIDGASRGQGATKDDHDGHAALGIAIHRNGEMIGQFCRGLGRRTNNEAEYEALIHALLMCWSADFRSPTIYSDSLLMVNQVNGTWNCHADALQPLLASVKELSEIFPFRLVHVERRAVWEADALANFFLDDLLAEEKTSKQKLSRKGKPIRD